MRLNDHDPEEILVRTTSGPAEWALSAHQVEYITIVTVSGRQLDRCRVAFPSITPLVGERATFVGDQARMVYCHLTDTHLRPAESRGPRLLRARRVEEP